jgi:deoxyribose-phosphate aldolase
MTLTTSAIPADVTSSDSALRRFLHGLPGVDQVGAQARAAALSTRSIKTDAKRWAIDTAISMIDLTTLEGQDTHGKVRALCAKGIRPDPTDASCPSVAAICVYPDLVATAKEQLGDSGVKVASVATSFPSGRAAMTIKLADVRDAVAARCRRDRHGHRPGRVPRPAATSQVYDEIAAVKAACQDAHLKVILETGELATYDNVRRASWLAMLAGGDFIKTSTGKVSPAATPAGDAGDARGGPRLPRQRPGGRSA